MSEPNQTINAAVSQDTIENLNLTKRKVATLRNVRFQHIHSLQKCTLPYIYSSKLGFAEFNIFITADAA